MTFLVDDRMWHLAEFPELNQGQEMTQAVTLAWNDDSYVFEEGTGGTCLSNCGSYHIRIYPLKS